MYMSCFVICNDYFFLFFFFFFKQKTAYEMRISDWSSDVCSSDLAELYRHDGDKAFLAKMWPHVLGAFEYMEKLRLSERTEANRAKNPAFYGLMPVSISHEGYSAKPMQDRKSVV